MKIDNIRFLVNSMLGGLARKLRMLGYDAEFSSGADSTLIRYRSRAESRIVLTKNAELVKTLGEKAWLVSGSGSREEFNSVVPLLRRITVSPNPLSRCLDCNSRLGKITKEEARDLIPHYSWISTDDFMRCPDCHKIYWKGTHHRRMLERIEEMKEELEK
ncbi:hypothetical protein EP232_02735 [bacterium]|nr:MAG: hypothetical protein EP232_02735 [bacterium]